ncbi:MAG TPA: type II toxin-antitoxin system VapC family toxin [Egibacteraceae bacterium]|nr:type II toxin-antitoxin system VapC family toxin [Actinomycetota bacterium]HWB71239.1 type II toxin-antitoxin system VapC family toxin [Egibacteraceae bacterium]
MRLLLDTHCWLWMQVTPERLGQRASALVRDLDNELLLSAASSWEIAVKYGLGRLVLPEPPERYVPDRLQSSGVTPLPVRHDHALRVSSLPHHHGDPFDRLLVAQAQAETLTLLTVDRVFDAYDVAVRWADS